MVMHSTPLHTASGPSASMRVPEKSVAPAVAQSAPSRLSVSNSLSVVVYAAPLWIAFTLSPAITSVDGVTRTLVFARAATMVMYERLSVWMVCPPNETSPPVPGQPSTTQLASSAVDGISSEASLEHASGLLGGVNW